MKADGIDCSALSLEMNIRICSAISRETDIKICSALMLEADGIDCSAILRETDIRICSAILLERLILRLLCGSFRRQILAHLTIQSKKFTYLNINIEVGPRFGSWAEGWKAISENSYA